jgi:hypothetical protein
VRVIRKDEPYPEEWNLTVFPEYTRTSKADPAIDKHTEDKRWTQAGICRFNALRQAIIANRQAYPGFKVRWSRQARKETRKGQVDPDVDDDDEDNIVDADDDLFDSIAPLQTQLTAAKQKHGTAEDSDDEETDDDE